MANYKNTKHRQEILNLFQTYHILTVAEIKKLLSDIDTVTIYRMLKRLTDSGIIKEVKHSTKYASFELNNNHQHFVCTTCGKIYPLEIDNKKLLNIVSAEIGTINNIHLDISGICLSCSQ